MDFILAGSFVQALNRLPARDQKDVKISVMDLQLNPATPSLSMHRVDRSKDPNFWSARVNRDIRLILHKTARSLLVAYVDHHDAAYGWAIRRKIEAHPKTSVMQIVQIPERVAEAEPELASLLKMPIDGAGGTPSALRPFSELPRNNLLSIGVPEEWIEPIRNVDAEGFLEIAHLLPPEAADALIEYAAGDQSEINACQIDFSDGNHSLFGTRASDDPYFRDKVLEKLELNHSITNLSRGLFGKRILAARMNTDDVDPFDFKDSQRQFIKVQTGEDLALALETSWQSWTPMRGGSPEAVCR